jgi:transposase InsO family protein
VEARLRQLGIFRIVTGKHTAPQTPNYVEETPATATDAAIPLTRKERALNASLKVAYDREMNEFCDRQEKAAGDILTHLSRLQRTHVVDCQDDPAWMWAMLKSVHLQQVPGMRFSAYNNLFSIVRGPEETLPAVASRVQEAIACVIELRPKQIMEVSTSPGGFTQTTRDYAISNLDNKLTLMAMLRALPHEEYADFVLSLMRQKDLTRANVKAAFQVEQTERDAHRGPLLSPSGGAALRTTTQAPRQNKPGIKCGFCTGDGHTEEDCYKKERARKDAQKVVEERCTGRNGGKKARANCVAAASPSSPAPSDSAKVTELAASASVCLAGLPDTHADAHWIADTGATSHMSPRRSWFTKLEPLAIPIHVANNHVVYSKGVGLVVLEPADKSLRHVLLSRVLYVPALQNNLLFILHLVANHRFRIKIEGKEMVFLQNGKHRFTAAIRGNTAWLNTSTPLAPEAALRGEAMLSRALWHRCLCHIGTDRLKQAIKGKVATRLVVESDTSAPPHCEPCICGKHHRNPFPHRASHRATSFLKRIHSDLHQLPVLTSSGFRYWLLFIDDYSRYFWIYLLQKKSETFDAFTQFKAMVEKQFNKLILCLHDDKGGEFIGIKWDTFFAKHGIRREHTVKASPQQNGIAERLNRTLEELLVAMLNSARLPARFWGEGLNYLRHIIVRSPPTSIPAGTTPYEMVHKRKPDYSPLRVFGCCAWAHIQRKEQKSLQDHAKPCVFLCCPEDFKGWKLWDLSANGGRGGIIVSRNVVWNEEEFPSLLRVAHDAIPKRFGCAAEPGDAECSPDDEEVSDSTDPEGVAIPLPFEPAAPLFDSNSSSSSLQPSSMASPTPAPPRTPPRTPPPREEWPALSRQAPRPPTRVAPWPQQQGTVPAVALRTARAPRPAAQRPAPATPAPAPSAAATGLRRSARWNAGVAPAANWFDATAQLKGKVRGVPVASYCEHGTRSTARPRTRTPVPSCEPSAGPSNEAPPMLDVEEEEEAAPETPREPLAADKDNDDDDLYAQPQARLARRLALDRVAELPADVRALLAQGLCSIYDNDDKYIELSEAMEHAFRAAVDTKAVSSDAEPKLCREAMRHPDSKLWHQAMVREMEAHLENGTWELIKLPHGCKAIGSKWVFKVKRNPNGTVERYKARLVAKGFGQRPGVNFQRDVCPNHQVGCPPHHPRARRAQEPRARVNRHQQRLPQRQAARRRRVHPAAGWLCRTRLYLGCPLAQEPLRPQAGRPQVVPPPRGGACQAGLRPHPL